MTPKQRKNNGYSLVNPYTRTENKVTASTPAMLVECCAPLRLNFRRSLVSGARFSKVPETFRARKVIAKSGTLPLQSCFIHIVLMRTEVLFIQEVSGAYTPPLLDTDELKMALRSRKVSGAFEKRAPGPGCSKAG